MLIKQKTLHDEMALKIILKTSFESIFSVKAQFTE